MGMESEREMKEGERKVAARVVRFVCESRAMMYEPASVKWVALAKML